MTWLLLLACTGQNDSTERFDSGERRVGVVRVDQLSIDFGDVSLGDSDARLLTFQNTSSQVFVDVWMEREPSDAAFTVDQTTTFLTPGQSMQWTVTFEPGDAGDASADLTIVSSDTAMNGTDIELLGHGVSP